jgi:glycosyltransferase involved in cell wall biosynthesis
MGEAAVAPSSTEDDRPLRVLYVTHVPPSPPRSGAPARMHGLMRALAERHELDAVSLTWPGDDPGSEAALRAYCREIRMVHADGASGWGRRLGQLASLASRSSFERRLHAVPELVRAVADQLAARPYDVVNVESPFFPLEAMRTAAPETAAPVLVLDEHNVEWHVVRQMARSEGGLARRAYNVVDWRKLRREETAAWRAVDGITVTSTEDQARLLEAVPAARVEVIPNAVDVDRFRPSPTAPAPDGRTVLFFGALGYFPNTDGILWFLDAIWPRIAAARAGARLKIVGPRPPRSVTARSGPCVEVTGFVEDLRPHLAEAAVVIAPLRMGGGTRLKIVEAMAMAKAVVSTRLGAEGLELTPGRDVVVADDPASFAHAVTALLDDPSVATRIGEAGRAQVVAGYSWQASAARLETFFRSLAGVRAARRAARSAG